MANTRLVSGCLRKYRMYRRLGVSVKFETGGSYLSRRNLGLLDIGTLGDAVMYHLSTVLRHIFRFRWACPSGATTGRLPRPRTEPDGRA